MTALAGFFGEGPRGQLQLDLIGNDIAFGAAVDVADGNDGGVLGILFAADDGLDLRDVERGEGDGIAAELWRGAVAADAVDDDIDGGGTGHCGSGDDADHACREQVGVVEADDFIGFAEALVEVVGKHGLGAVNGLLRRLADEHKGAVPLRLCGREGAGSADEYRGVDVVAAGVHDSGGLSGVWPDLVVVITWLA